MDEKEVDDNDEVQANRDRLDTDDAAESDIGEMCTLVSEIQDTHEAITENRPDDPEMVSYALDDMRNQLNDLSSILGQVQDDTSDGVAP